VSQVFHALKKAGIDVSRPGGVPGAANTPEPQTTVPPVGLVPKVANPTPAMRASAQGILPEFIRLYYAVQALKAPGASFVLQFVSATPGEGASTVAAQFARVAALEGGQGALLVDCTIYRRLGADGNVHPELTVVDCFRSGLTPRDHLPSMRFGGETRVNRARLSNARHPLLDIEDAEFGRMLSSLRQEFPVTVMDCSAVSESPDALALTRFCDGTILVVEAEGVRPEVVKLTRTEVERHGGQILGVVFNKRRSYLPDWLQRRL
jgi:Mrp family chromosome partitioning ATPase